MKYRLINWLCFAGVDLFIPASESRYLPGRAVWEGASDEEVGALPEQVLARAAGAASAEDAERRSSRSRKILIQVI